MKLSSDLSRFETYIFFIVQVAVFNFAHVPGVVSYGATSKATAAA